jgi:hypothetical protein
MVMRSLSGQTEFFSMTVVADGRGSEATGSSGAKP